MQWLKAAKILLETTLNNSISLLLSCCGNGPGEKRNKNDFVEAQSWAKSIKQELTMKNRRANGAKLQVVLLACPFTDDNVSYMAWGARQIRVLAHNKRPVCKWGQTLVPERISDCLMSPHTRREMPLRWSYQHSRPRLHMKTSWGQIHTHMLSNTPCDELF